MSCRTVANYEIPCDSSGGAKAWYIVPINGANGLPSMTVTRDQTTNVITGITANDISGWKKWEVEPETSTFTDTKTVSKPDKSKFFTQTATIVLHGTSDVMVEELNKMNSRYVVFCQDNNGVYHLLFEENGGQMADNFTIGTAMGDQYAHTVTFTGNEMRKSSIVDESIIQTLFVPVNPGS